MKRRLESAWTRVQGFVRANPHVWLALYVPVFLLAFALAEHVITPQSAYWRSWVPLDDKIPFLEWFVVPYCLWYPFLAGAGLYTLVREPAAFRRFMYFLMAGFSLSLLICFVIPNGQDLRPESFGRENLFTWMVAGIYRADTNTNVFPSMHVVGAMAAAAAVFDCPRLRRLRIPAAALAILISISTVFIKQHSVLDIAGGLVLSLPIGQIIYRRQLSEWWRTWQQRSRGRRRRLLALARAKK